MCLAEFPLGSALGQHARNDWLYQLAGHVSAERLNETLPVMAALHVLLTTKFQSGSTGPYILGWKLNGPDLDCEVDIAAVLEERGQPILIVGEVKNYRDSTEDIDIANLIRVQQRLRAIGAECFILIAVMRDLRPEEIKLLRDAFTNVPNALTTGNRLLPALPIILTDRNLSATVHEDDDPRLWSPGEGLSGIAQELCRRNLGLHEAEDKHDGHEWRYTIHRSPTQTDTPALPV